MLPCVSFSHPKQGSITRGFTNQPHTRYNRNICSSTNSTRSNVSEIHTHTHTHTHTQNIINITVVPARVKSQSICTIHFFYININMKVWSTAVNVSGWWLQAKKYQTTFGYILHSTFFRITKSLTKDRIQSSSLAMYMWFQQLVVLHNEMPSQTHAGNLQGNICQVFDPKSSVNRKTHQVRVSYNAVWSIGMPVQSQCKLHEKSTYLAQTSFKWQTSKWWIESYTMKMPISDHGTSSSKPGLRTLKLLQKCRTWG